MVSDSAFSVPLGQTAANETNYMTKLVNKRAGLPGDIYDVPKSKRFRAMSGHMRYASVR